MPGSTVSTTIATAVTLGAGAYASPLTITTTGGIAPAASGSTALTVDLGLGQVLNQGSITGGVSGGTGISLALGSVINSGRVGDGTGYGGFGYSGVAVSLSGGAFTNTAGGTIHGGNDQYAQSGVAVSQSGGTLVNDGAIASGGAHGAYGVILTDAILTNSSTGSISGGGGVLQTGGTALNDGTITAGYLHGDGVYLTGDGSFTNAGQITGGKGNTGVTAGVGVLVSTGSALANTGTIIGGADYAEQLSTTPRGGRTGGDGVLFSGTTNFTNNGVIIGGEGDVDGGGGVSLTSGTLVNSGSISGGVGNSQYGNTVGIGYGGFGVDIAGLLVNDGQIVGGMAGDDGQSGDGVIITAGTLINNQIILGGYSSTITGAAPRPGTAVQASNGVVIVNNGTIAAASTRYALFGGTAIYDSGGATVTNNGVITGGSDVGPFNIIAGDGIALKGVGLVINTGTITAGSDNNTFGATGYGVVVAEGGTILNSGYIAAGATGGSQDAIFFGSYTSQLILDPTARFHGSVVAVASIGNLLELSAGTAAAAGSLDMGGSFSGFHTIAFDADAAWLLQGTTLELAAAETISGFTSSDTIELQGFTFATDSYTAGSGLVLTNGTATETLGIAGSFTTANFLVSSIATGTEIELLCYLRGTRILTPAGEVPVEALGIGDAVITRFGGYRQIKWIGRQSYARRFVRHNRDQLPVRIAAGALGPHLPARDLFISPGHSMLVGGALILAKALVNGVTITQDEAPEEIHYYQLEFETHDCVLAEGAWSESFADSPDLRGKFHNVAEFHALYPDYETPARQSLCAPRPFSGALLEAALRGISARAASGRNCGPLRGWVDAVGEVAEGWAQDVAAPELPVLLEVLVQGRVLGTALACAYRDDLAQAGIGQGWCQFTFALPIMPAAVQRSVQVRRAADGVALPMSSACEASLGISRPMPRRRAAS